MHQFPAIELLAMELPLAEVRETWGWRRAIRGVMQLVFHFVVAMARPG